MRKFLVILFLLLAPRAAFPQAEANRTANGNLTAAATTCNAAACTMLVLQPGASTATIQLTGTFVGTVTFEVSSDFETTWAAILGNPIGGGAQASSATATGVWAFQVGAQSHIRARCSAFTSGTIVTWILSSIGAGGSPPGGLTLVGNQNVNVAQINGITPLMGNGVTGSGSHRVTVASDNTAFTVNAAQSGTWTVQPGNTANTTAWLFKLGDVCSGAKTFVSINQTANTQLLTGTASNRTYICAISLVTATAQNIALVAGTGSVCGTSTVGLSGGTTAATGWNFAANGGIAEGGANATIKKTTVDADNVCLLQSGAGQVSGTLSYVVAPN